ncbi:MAG TPA: PDZ domain-containing protein, partial [Gemmatimonadaceae bacterium]|nr:PDZ domain-containing protein [Gemmatimonadaceae bacterium]
YGPAALGGVIHIYTKPGRPGARSARSMPNDSAMTAAQGRYGFAISCLPSCTKARAADGTDYWKFDGHPPIAGIRAGGPAAMAGLQVGDLVTQIDGISILTEQGALRFQRAERKETLHVTVLRSGKEVGYLLKVR